MLNIQSLSNTTVEAAVTQLPASSSGCYLFQQSLLQYYLPQTPNLSLLVFAFVDAGELVQLAVCPADRFAAEAELDAFVGIDLSSQLTWLRQHNIACFDLRKPLRLAPIHIAKPWGQEIWYTGIENRGQSSFIDGKGLVIPMPWLLEVAPIILAQQRSRNITLLKILDPLPEPVFGDLYFEMHEKKQEVYVVTAIDNGSWPAGKGGIRFGFCQHKRAQFGSDSEFKLAYLHTVKKYEEVRREADALIDEMRAQASVGLNDPVDALQSKLWLAQLPQELRDREERARLEVDSFAAILPLELGDVVKVPCFTPHSLLHGVTTVEFQTPVYERKILSFAQKVLTQNHWDTEAAMDLVSLDAPVNPSLPVLLRAEGVVVEEVVRFDDFSVQRLRLAAGASLALAASNEYALVMNVAGNVSYAEEPIACAEALFVSAILSPADIKNTGSTPAVVLVSLPH